MDAPIFSSKNKNAVCVRCGFSGELTFEHIPPRATDLNKPAKLFNALDSIGNAERLPWDFSGRKYKNEQRGTGGYYLCRDCNSWAGVELVPAYIHFIQELQRHNIVNAKPDDIKELSWSVELKNIQPLLVAKQILLMHACINGRAFVTKYKFEDFINQTDSILENFDHKEFMFINAGSMSLSYPLSAALSGMMTKKPMTHLLTGVDSGVISFQLRLNSNYSTAQYIDISKWFYGYKDSEIVDVSITIPVQETNVPLPAMHASKRQIIDNKQENKRNGTI